MLFAKIKLSRKFPNSQYFFFFRLELKWSVIEFERSSLVVCENIGTLPLTLKRTGDSEGLAFVSIDARDRTTQKDEDYIPSSAQQVQFDPGSVDFFLKIIAIFQT